MRLIRFGSPGQERPGIEKENGERIDVSYHLVDYTPEFFASGGLDRLKQIVAEGKHLPAVPKDARLGPPVARPHKFIAVGLNYRKHAEETNNPIPTEPVLFTKATSCLSGPNDEIVIPRGSLKLDYEVELAFVMTKKASYLESEAEAMNHVGGFMVCNDVSERHFQSERAGQWMKGKGCDTFGPLGPVLVTTDELKDYGKLAISLTVNGETRQSSNTDDMIFTVPHIVWYISQFMTLEPGDVITTGTPSGVASGMKPQGWLKAGDVVEATIEKIGTLSQKVVG